MTVIAWDGRTLAGDRRGTANGHISTVQKVYKVGAYIVGFSGCAALKSAFLDWLDRGLKPAEWPTSYDKQDAMYAIAIDRDGRVWKFENTPYPFQLFDSHVTSGSGRDYARMAMHLGKTAREAVELTCEFDENCGNGVDTLTLDVFNEPSTIEGRP